MADACDEGRDAPTTRCAYPYLVSPSRRSPTFQMQLPGRPVSLSQSCAAAQLVAQSVVWLRRVRFTRACHRRTGTSVEGCDGQLTPNGLRARSPGQTETRCCRWHLEAEHAPSSIRSLPSTRLREGRAGMVDRCRDRLQPQALVSVLEALKLRAPSALASAPASAPRTSLIHCNLAMARV